MNKFSILFLGFFLATALLPGCQKEIRNSEFAVTSTNATYITLSKEKVFIGEEVTVTFDNGYNNNCGNIELQVSNDKGATWKQLAMGSVSNGKMSYSFKAIYEGEYLFRGQWIANDQDCASSGNNISLVQGQASFPLIVEKETCGLSFEGSVQSCDQNKEVVLTFSSPETIEDITIEGSLNGFMGEYAEIYVDGAELILSQWNDSENSGRQIRLEGNVLGCNPITIRLKWKSKNGIKEITSPWTIKDKSGKEIIDPVDILVCH